MREFEESESKQYGKGEKPVKVGDEYDVTIESQGAKGDGICKIKGLVIFVPGGQAGETIKVRVNKVFQKYAFAEKI